MHPDCGVETVPELGISIRQYIETITDWTISIHHDTIKFTWVIRPRLEGICPPISINTTMASQDENQVANHIGSVAYYYIVQTLSAGLCYGQLDSTWSTH